MRMSSPLPLLAAIVIAGCSLAAHQRAVARDAAPRLQCPESQIDVARVSPSLERASGCGRAEYYLFEGLSWGDTEELQQRAGFDLDCPVHELVLTSLSQNDPPQLGVSGCGRRAVYIHARTESGEAWIMDSTSTLGDTPADREAPHAEGK